MTSKQFVIAASVLAILCLVYFACRKGTSVVSAAAVLDSDKLVLARVSGSRSEIYIYDRRSRVSTFLVSLDGVALALGAERRDKVVYVSLWDVSERVCSLHRLNINGEVTEEILLSKEMPITILEWNDTDEALYYSIATTVRPYTFGGDIYQGYVIEKLKTGIRRRTSMRTFSQVLAVTGNHSMFPFVLGDEGKEKIVISANDDSGTLLQAEGVTSALLISAEQWVLAKYELRTMSFELVRASVGSMSGSRLVIGRGQVAWLQELEPGTLIYGLDVDGRGISEIRTLCLDDGRDSEELLLR